MYSMHRAALESLNAAPESNGRDVEYVLVDKTVEYFEMFISMTLVYHRESLFPLIITYFPITQYSIIPGLRMI